MAEPKSKQKVAVLGGGMSALTAAFALTDPQQGGKYDITVYQMGWRIGGKGASGRNADLYNRIEEHGLHIWFGFYDNAFALMRQCYEEMARPDPAPLATLDEAFKPQNYYIINEYIEGEWRPWHITFPENDDEPGQMPSVWDLFRILVGWVRELAHQYEAVNAQTKLDHSHHGGDRLILGHLENWINGFVTHEKANARAILSGLHDLVKNFPDDHVRLAKSDLNPVVGLLDLTARVVWAVLKDKVIAGDDTARRAWILIYAGITNAKGMIVDDLIFRGFDTINHLEFHDWMYSHATFPDDEEGDPNKIAYYSAPFRTFYDAAFAYKDGNTDTPNMAAGVALRGILRIAFAYKKSVIFEMQAGMGDTVFTPLYLTLLARGVKFEFFNRVTALNLSEDRTSIGSIDVSRQINLKHGRYNPLITVNDLACWPSEPLYDQIEDGDRLKSANVNLEHYNDSWTDTGGSFSLKSGEDFDHVILGIALPSLPSTCQQLIEASPKWQAMIAEENWTRTQAFQLWFNQTRQQMGLSGPPAIIGSYVEPWSSITDFSHLLPREQWPENYNGMFLTYSCGVMPIGAPRDQAKADGYVYDNMKSFLETDINAIWPGAARADNDCALDYSLLLAPVGCEGEDRLKGQYWRANVDTTELYVLTTAGSVKYRLKGGESGFNNLYLAGDWTDNGFNIGSIEGCALSGLQASRAISGYPVNIPGEKDL